MNSLSNWEAEIKDILKNSIINVSNQSLYLEERASDLKDIIRLELR